VRQRIPSGVGGNGIRGIRHQSNLVGYHLKDQIDEFRDRVSLDIELGLDHFFQIAGILIPDMPFVRPGVDGDSLSAKGLDIADHFHKVGHIPAPGIPKGCNFVHIYAQTHHFSLIFGS
jgi:hypothetical protein